MSITTNAQQFASRGDEWNARNTQHHACNRGWRVRRHPDGTLEKIFGDEIEGYDHVPSHVGPHAAIHKPVWVDPPRPQLDPSARLRCNEQRKIAAMLRNPFK